MREGSALVIDLRDQPTTPPDELTALAERVARHYQLVRERVDTTGDLFASHELRCALIEVRRTRRRLLADVVAA